MSKADLERVYRYQAEHGASIAEAARALGLKVRAVYMWRKQFRDLGGAKSRPQAGRPPGLAEAEEALVEAAGAGLKDRDCAGLAGIHRHTLARWLQKADEGDPEYEGFGRRFRQARAQHALFRMEQLRDPQPYVWQAHMTVLERSMGYTTKRADAEDEGASSEVEQEANLAAIAAMLESRGATGAGLSAEALAAELEKLAEEVEQ